MIQLIECVPNFSVGRDPATVHAIAEELSKEPGLLLVGSEADYDHNRSVLTCIGRPDSVISGVYNACRKATELIDLRSHRGVHPRIGATDVIPLIPLVDTSMEQCVNLAKDLGARIGNFIGLPVFLYGHAALKPEHRDLAQIRKGGGYEHLRNQSKIYPDFGPSMVHPSAGAVAVGAREILIAYNINLQSTDVKIARRIAFEIRECNQGLPGVKALGLRLANKHCVQVSMNITDYRKTSISDAYHSVQNKALQLGVDILESELIGLAPEAAFGLSSPDELKLKGITPDRYLDFHIKRAVDVFYPNENPDVTV